MKLKIIASAITLLLGGCATNPTPPAVDTLLLEKRLDEQAGKYIGKTEEEVLRDWGTPENIHDTQSGGTRFFQYERIAFDEKARSTEVTGCDGEGADEHILAFATGLTLGLASPLWIARCATKKQTVTAVGWGEAICRFQFEVAGGIVQGYTRPDCQSRSGGFSE